MQSDYRPDALLAEVVGTFALVFATTGSIMVNEMSGGVVTHIGVAAAPGLVVAAMIYAVGDISAAHFNPAVTIGFWSVGRLPARLVAPYIAKPGGRVRCWPASPRGCCCRNTAA